MNKGFMDYLKTENPDILGIQETKLQQDQIPVELAQQDDYKIYWSHARRKGYSGVALFTKTEPQNVSYSIGIDEFDDEGRVVRAEYPDFILYNVYFPNGQMNDDRLNYKLAFYDRFLLKMREDRETGKTVLVCGDYNTAHKEIDLANPKENEKYSGFLPIERAWLDKLVTDGWADTFRQFDQSPGRYSWWTYRMKARERNIGWRIDYFWIDEKSLPRLQNAFIQPDVTGSDHCPVGIEFEAQ